MKLIFITLFSMIYSYGLHHHIRLRHKLKTKGFLKNNNKKISDSTTKTSLENE